MLTIRRIQEKIFNPVVIPDMVYVMNYFLRAKKTAQVLFHHKAMLPNITVPVVMGMFPT